MGLLANFRYQDSKILCLNEILILLKSSNDSMWNSLFGAFLKDFADSFIVWSLSRKVITQLMNNSSDGSC